MSRQSPITSGQTAAITSSLEDDASRVLGQIPQHLEALWPQLHLARRTSETQPLQIEREWSELKRPLRHRRSIELRSAGSGRFRRSFGQVSPKVGTSARSSVILSAPEGLGKPSSGSPVGGIRAMPDAVTTSNRRKPRCQISHPLTRLISMVITSQWSPTTPSERRTWPPRFFSLPRAWHAAARCRLRAGVHYRRSGEMRGTGRDHRNRPFAERDRDGEIARAAAGRT